MGLLKRGKSIGYEGLMTHLNEDSQPLCSYSSTRSFIIFKISNLVIHLRFIDIWLTRLHHVVRFKPLAFYEANLDFNSILFHLDSSNNFQIVS